jgi:hypothetical protein
MSLLGVTVNGTQFEFHIRSYKVDAASHLAPPRSSGELYVYLWGKTNISKGSY